MKTFAIYEQSENNRVVVKVGFCWPGCFWSGFWLLSARLWEKAGIIWGGWAILCFVALGVAAGGGRDGADVAWFILFAGQLVIGFIVGDNGNKWRRMNLRARGFNLVAAVEAESKDGALVKLREMSAEELAAAKGEADQRIEEIEGKRPRSFLDRLRSFI